MSTSILDFGFPELQKIFRGLRMRYFLNAGEEIIVSYCLDDQLEAYGTAYSETNLVWTVLGKLQASTSITAGGLDFPTNTISKAMKLKFELFLNANGAMRYRSYIRSYEIEYMFPPSNLEVCNFVAIVADNIEILPNVRENSGAFVAATLYSLSRTPRTHVVELPWPTAHTIRAIVSIQSPGGMLPGFAREGKFDGGDVPIQIDEV
jgi:hypothetical protein